MYCLLQHWVVDMLGNRTFFKCDRFAIEVDGEKCSPFATEYGMECTLRYEHKGRWVQLERLPFSVESASDEEVERIKRFATGYFEERKNNVVGERGNV